MEFQSSGAEEISEMVCGGGQSMGLMAAGAMTRWSEVWASGSLV